MDKHPINQESVMPYLGADDPHRALADISLEDLDWPAEQVSRVFRIIYSKHRWDSVPVSMNIMKGLQ